MEIIDIYEGEFHEGVPLDYDDDSSESDQVEYLETEAVMAINQEFDCLDSKQILFKDD